MKKKVDYVCVHLKSKNVRDSPLKNNIYKFEESFTKYTPIKIFKIFSVFFIKLNDSSYYVIFNNSFLYYRLKI